MDAIIDVEDSTICGQFLLTDVDVIPSFVNTENLLKAAQFDQYYKPYWRLQPIH